MTATQLAVLPDARPSCDARDRVETVRIAAGGRADAEQPFDQQRQPQLSGVLAQRQ